MSFSSDYDAGSNNNASTIIEATFTGTGALGVTFVNDSLDTISIQNRTLKVIVVGYNDISDTFSSMTKKSHLNIVDLSEMVENTGLGEGQTQGLDGFAFSGCTNLREITLFPNCEEIETNAFYDCTNLKEIYKIPFGMTAVTIGINTIFGGSTAVNMVSIFEIARDITTRDDASMSANFDFDPENPETATNEDQTYNVTAIATFNSDTTYKASKIFSETVFAVSNSAPTFTSTAVTTATEDSLYTYTVTTSDVDSGDSVTVTATIPTGQNWLSFDQTTKVLSGTPLNSNVGSHNIVLTASDESLSTTQEFTITVANANDAPVFNPTTDTANATEDTAFTYTVVAASDVDSGDSLTYSKQSAPTWVSFDASTRELTGTPLNANVGSNTVVIRATDGSDAYADFTLTITVANVNEAPTIGYKSYSDPQVPNKLEVEVTDNDADPSSYTYQWQRSSDNEENWTNIDGATTATYVFDESSDNMKSFRAIVSFTYNDGNDGTANSIARPYLLPTWNDGDQVPNDKKTATVGEEYTYSPTTSAESATYYLLEKPEWLSLNSSDSSTLTGTPTTAEDPQTVKLAVVEDSVFYMASVLEFTITVSAALTPPTIVYKTITVPQDPNKLEVEVTDNGDAEPSSYTYQWQRSSDGSNWDNITGQTTTKYEFTNDDKPIETPSYTVYDFRVTVSFNYNDGTTGSETLANKYYDPKEWDIITIPDDSKTATVGTTYSYSPTAKDETDLDSLFYLVEAPGWLKLESDSQSTMTGTPKTAHIGKTQTVKIAIYEELNYYNADFLEFKITVLPFKPADKDALQSAIDKWYVLANATAGGSTGTTSTSETTGEVSEKTKFYIQDVTDPIEIDIDGELTSDSYLIEGNGITKSNIVKVEIGTKVTSIGDKAFWRCIILQSVTIPDSVRYMRQRVFDECSLLESVTFDGTSQVMGIPRAAFATCSALKSLTIPDSVTNIDDYAFYDCTALQSVTLPTNVNFTTIGELAFSGCNVLQSLTIPDSTDYITEKTFLDSRLTTLYMSENNGLSLSAGSDQTVGGKTINVIFFSKDAANNYEGPEYFGNPNTWDTSLITDLSYVFFKKDQTNHPDISTWDVSKVTSMQGTFSNSTFNGELNNWNVASVTDFSYTFANNVVFNQELKRWNVQDAITMESMFDNAYSFNQTIEPLMMQNKDGTDFPTQLTWDEPITADDKSGYLTIIYGSATPQTNPTTFKGVFGMIALLKKTYLVNIPVDPTEVGKYNTIKSSFSKVISKLTTNQLEIKKYNSTYNEKQEKWIPTSPTIYFANTDGKTGDDLSDAKNKLNKLRLNTIVDGMLLIKEAYDIAKSLGETDYSHLISEMNKIYDNVYANLPFYVAWYAPLLETKAKFMRNALTMQSGKEGTINQSLKDFIDTNPIKSINDKDYDSTDKQRIVEFSSADLFDKFKTAYNPQSE